MLALAPVTHETLTGRGHVMSMDLGFRLVCVCVCVLGLPLGLGDFSLWDSVSWRAPHVNRSASWNLESRLG